MLYQCKDKVELFMEYIGKMSALIEESLTSNIGIVGDFIRECLSSIVAY